MPRPLIADLSSKFGDPLSSSVLKTERITAVSYYFEGDYESNCGDVIWLGNSLGKMILVDRHLDGRSGHIDFGPTGIAGGKARVQLRSNLNELRRARLVLWIDGERCRVESFDYKR